MGCAVIYCAAFLLKQQILRNLERQSAEQKRGSFQRMVLFRIKEVLPLYIHKYFLYLHVLNFHIGVNLNHSKAQS